MIALKLPDGSVREIEKPMDGFAFAESISKSLAKKAVALKIDGEMKDLSTIIDKDCAIEVVVRDSDDGVERKERVEEILADLRAKGELGDDEGAS